MLIFFLKRQAQGHWVETSETMRKDTLCPTLSAQGICHSDMMTYITCTPRVLLSLVATEQGWDKMHTSRPLCDSPFLPAKLTTEVMDHPISPYSNSIQQRSWALWGTFPLIRRRYIISPSFSEELVLRDRVCVSVYGCSQ